MKDETHAAILKKFSDACKVLGHVLVVALQCAAADFCHETAARGIFVLRMRKCREELHAIAQIFNA